MGIVNSFFFRFEGSLDFPTIKSRLLHEYNYDKYNLLVIDSFKISKIIISTQHNILNLFGDDLQIDVVFY